MGASGWTLYERRPDGAVFTKAGSDSGISTGVHLILLVLTLGFWLPILVVVELASSGRAAFCELVFDSQGDVWYQPIKRPRR